MTCREVIDFLDDYVTMELSPLQKAEFEKHLSDCSHCLAYLDSYKRTVVLEKAAFEDPAVMVGQMPDELVDAILRARRGEGGNRM